MSRNCAATPASSPAYYAAGMHYHPKNFRAPSLQGCDYERGATGEFTGSRGRHGFADRNPGTMAASFAVDAASMPRRSSQNR